MQLSLFRCIPCPGHIGGIAQFFFELHHAPVCGLEVLFLEPDPRRCFLYSLLVRVQHLLLCEQCCDGVVSG